MLHGYDRQEGRTRRTKSSSLISQQQESIYYQMYNPEKREKLMNRI